MKVQESAGISVYKSILEMQKQLVDTLIQGNLKTDQSQNIQENSQQKPQNIIEGNKVSIYV
ncbi:hypothetical protein [Persephonella sp.]|uniref:hypothetical protein n=1 Tax=Persephonella sp. TaxID=2060922 RepID=UPI0025EFA5ED|nr:hypothetical protein [Persephonella sp.]